MNAIRITPQEAFTLRGQTTTDELNISHDIYEMFMENVSSGDDQFDMMSAMATIYMAGYVSGIRTEREKHRNKKSAPTATTVKGARTTLQDQFTADGEKVQVFSVEQEDHTC